jgi:prepilin-type N-terminal cleavage/methylation domain-containing protein
MNRTPADHRSPMTATKADLPAMRPPAAPATGRGFTLVELLVVITIIVILLALLAPAMDQAIYQAELAVCGARLRSTAVSVQAYSFNYRRHYPYREGVLKDSERPIFAWRPNSISDGHSWDDRKLFSTFLSLNKQLVCPFNLPIDIEGSKATTLIEANYDLWFGFKYLDNPGMLRVGDALGWTNPDAPGQTYRFNVLASDYEIYHINFKYLEGSHPDYDTGVMGPMRHQDSDPFWTASRWRADTLARGPIDRNFAFDDGSVFLLKRLRMDPTAPVESVKDERLVNLPPFAAQNDVRDHKNTLPLRR